MSIDTINIPVEIDPDVIEEDKGLSEDEHRAEGNLKAAKRRKQEAHAALCQLRWEMTTCPHGPLYSLDVYAKAVGVKPKAIQVSIDTWERSKDNVACAYADEDTHFGKRKLPTEDQIDNVNKTKHAAEVGELKALAADMLARHFGVTTSTITNHHRDRINDAVGRLRDVHGEVTLDEAKPFLNNIAMAMREEHDLHQRREREVRRWMAVNRGLDQNDVKNADVQKMMVRIATRVEKHETTWKDAEDEVRSWDAKAREAERNINEMARKAQMAILDLQQALASVKLASIAVVTAVRRVEEDGIALDDDIREIAADDIDHAWSALSLAKAALTGNSGTNWDNELQKLQGTDN